MPNMKSITTTYPVSVYTADQVRTIDRLAIKKLGVTGYELMCRAGEASFSLLQNCWPDVQTIAVFCGQGNNSGDAYVLAHLALQAGIKVKVIAVTPGEQLQNEAAIAWDQYTKNGGKVEVFSADCIITEDVIVDGLLGTGLTRQLQGDMLSAVQLINTSEVPVLALDMPTGLDADTGMLHGDCVKADITLTFVGLKQGLFLGVGPNYVGKLEFSDLSIHGKDDNNDKLFDQIQPQICRLTPRDLDICLKPRAQLAHKGTNGSLLLVGGAPGMAGAIRLAAEAALRSGAGIVRVATHPDSVSSVMAGRAEIMCHGVIDEEELQPLLGSAEAVILGPGLGQSVWAKNLWKCITKSTLPVVLDADGLNLLSAENKIKPLDRGNWILTPHPGEAAKLLCTDLDSVQRDRLGAVKELAQTFSSVAVLKGGCSLVAGEDIFVRLCDRGNPGMATPGMGDVLAGIIGGFLVQVGNLGLATRAAVFVHAVCGDIAALDGERGLLAGDIIRHIPLFTNPPFVQYKLLSD
tara:strand:+ start:432 stop:1991 length:1560 start_codon:yes stop_codon:yes gene_type:complete